MGCSQKPNASAWGKRKGLPRASDRWVPRGGFQAAKAGAARGEGGGGHQLPSAFIYGREGFIGTMPAPGRKGKEVNRMASGDPIRDY